ncbi:MAG: glycosyltransferase [Bacteroidia bacterium]|nr:glycosyltransferase [Bacteroidia bacterium]
MFTGKTIFIAPLDWGLGHATRCVPIIRELEKKNKIIIGTTPAVKSLFDEEFPQLQQVELPSYNIRYSQWLPLWIKLLISWPGIKKVIASEHQILKKLVSDLNIDVVISDNRFGAYTNKVPSVFITHQLFLKTPFAGGLAQNINKKYILKFSEVWVPDYENENDCLSGKLSHGSHFHANVKYIGPQSRLTFKDNLPSKYDVLFLLSGPEPQQSILGQYLISTIAKKPDLKYALVSNSFVANSTPQLDVFKSPKAEKLSELIAQSQKIVCRSGYSTLMDLHLLKKKNIVLIPTPGQTEQEYLAELWQNKFKISALKQSKAEQII